MKINATLKLFIIFGGPKNKNPILFLFLLLLTYIIGLPKIILGLPKTKQTKNNNTFFSLFKKKCSLQKKANSVR